ncbi:hypothetical protein LI82_08795 [Methanococcoides methylutens]|uniref:Carbohydrate-binding/sugar hydrolysis domain-containing protein n=1 Tax=Methanococcoides methylutens TaxID=2226 RepID=A0A099T153_METMT|nr:NosD domain-containing protein [Methanococcoides methylutens]KGK97853.1 hypothetical protein LI82_08795 [Methanococcoides methylutens]
MQVKSHHIFYIIMAIGFLTMVTGSAAADTIIVDDSGTVDYTTIQAAIDAANNGDTIFVYPGKYSENVDVNKELAIVAESGNPDDTAVQAADSNDSVFHVTANNVTISGFNIKGANSTEKNSPAYGIYLDGVPVFVPVKDTEVQGCIITNNRLFNNSIGVFLEGSSNNVLSNNTASGNRIAIFLSSSNNSELSNNAVLNNEGGILMYGGSNNTFNNNNISNNGIAIVLHFYSNDNTFINNRASDNEHGIYIREASNLTLINNTANFNKRDGIYLDSSHYNVLEGNTANSNGEHGIYLNDFSWGNYLGNNTASNNEHGILLYYYSDHNSLINNTANSNEQYGIYLNEISNNSIEGNTANSNKVHGIYLKSSTFNTIIDNTANLNGYHGINLNQSNNKRVNTDVITHDFKYCKFLEDSSNNNTVSGNHLFDNGKGLVANVSENNIGINYINDRGIAEMPFIGSVLTLIMVGIAFMIMRRE